MGNKNTAKKVVAKKSVAKKSVAKKAVVPTALQALQVKLDAVNKNQHWSETLRKRFNWCSVPAWVSSQKSLKDAWANCERTDWMMTMLRSIKDERKSGASNERVLDEATRDRMQFEMDWMREEFGKRFKSRHDGNASSIWATHLGNTPPRKPWTQKERMQMTDFIRFYFPTPAVQVRKSTNKK